MGFINAVGTLVVSLPDGTHDYTVTADGFADATGQLTVDGDVVTVNVTMTPVYEVTFSVAGENGTLTALANSTDISSGDLVLEGSDVEFTATPADNYRVKEWKLDSEVVDENTTNSYTVTNLMATTNVTVEFEVIPETTYEVTFSVVGGNGTLAASASSVDVSSGDLVPEGSNIVFTATPDEEYEVKEWRLNSEVVDENTTNSYTVSNLMAATDVTVEFKLIVGVNTNALANLKVYPNPFSNEINITSDRVNRVIITNIVGQRVMDITLNGQETINTSELSNGVYLVTFEGTNGEQTVRKMIKKQHKQCSLSVIKRPGGVTPPGFFYATQIRLTLTDRIKLPGYTHSSLKPANDKWHCPVQHFSDNFW